MKLASRIFRRDDWVITSKFGYRKPLKTSVGVTSSFHSGVDYGTHVQNWNQYALEKGIVLSAGKSTVSGNYAWIKYPRLGIKLLHCHMDELKVKSGQEVDENIVIGTTGKTGRVTGVHLHLGMQYLNKATYVDPELYDYIPEEKASEVKPEQVPESKEEYISYTIVRGDTLSGIAKKYNCTVDELVRINNITNKNIIITGHKLNIPTKNTTPAEPVKESFDEGQKVVPIRLVNCDGKPLTQYDDVYIITHMNDDKTKATLSARGQVWATLYVKDIKHV